MSQQPRRRRRRRRGGSGSGGATNENRGADPQRQQAQASGSGNASGGRRKKRRRRRGPGGARPERVTFEQLMASYRPKLEQLTTDPDGQDLDEIIGELQSVWGVPQYPQEYRITIKVAEERNGGNNRPRTPKQPAQVTVSGVQREKAPAAPRMGAGSGSESDGDAPRRKRRRRRRRSGGGSGGSGTPPAPAS